MRRAGESVPHPAGAATAKPLHSKAKGKPTELARWAPPWVRCTNIKSYPEGVIQPRPSPLKPCRETAREIHASPVVKEDVLQVAHSVNVVSEVDKKARKLHSEKLFPHNLRFFGSKGRYAGLNTHGHETPTRTNSKHKFMSQRSAKQVKEVKQALKPLEIHQNVKNKNVHTSYKKHMGIGQYKSNL